MEFAEVCQDAFCCKNLGGARTCKKRTFVGIPVQLSLFWTLCYAILELTFPFYLSLYFSYCFELKLWKNFSFS